MDTRNNSAAHANEHGDLTLAPFPGENPLRHEAQEWLESTEAKFANKGLLVVANGGQPTSLLQIIDIPLSAIPELPMGQPGYERRFETRLRAHIDNQRNAERRWEITMRAWTAIYSALKESTAKNAPMLSRELLEVCDSELRGGY